MPSTNEHEIARREPTDPWTEFDRLFDDLRGRFYGRLGGVPLGAFLAEIPTDGARNLRAAPTDITDNGKSFKVVAEIPGIPKEKLEVRIRGSTVEIRGESEKREEKTQGEFVHRERTYQGYYRSMELPEPVVAGEAKATVKDGILELDLPKLAPTPSPDEVKVPVQ